MRIEVELTPYEADVLMRPDPRVGHDPYQSLKEPAEFATDALVDRTRESALDKVRDAILKARVPA